MNTQSSNITTWSQNRLGLEIAKVVLAGYLAYWHFTAGWWDLSQLWNYAIGTVFGGYFLNRAIGGHNSLFDVLRMHRRDYRLKQAQTNDYLSRDARWAAPDDYKHLFDPNAGVLVGRCLATGRPLFSGTFNSRVVIAPAGSGKTTSCVVPAVMGYQVPNKDAPWIWRKLRKPVREASTVIFDTKRELLEVTGDARRAKGTVTVIDGKDPDTAHINLLDGVLDAIRGDRPIEEIHDQTGFIFGTLLPTPKDRIQDSSFWVRSAQDLGKFITLRSAQISPAETTLPGLWRLVNDPGRLSQMIDQAVADGVRMDERTGDAHCLYEANSLGYVVTVMARDLQKLKDTGDDGDNNYFLTFRRELSAALSSFTPGSTLARITDGSGFRFSSLKTDPGSTVYIRVDATQMETYEVFLKLAAEMCIAELTDECLPNNPVVLQLDEATNISNFRTVDKVQLVRWANIYFDVSMQDLEGAYKNWTPEDARILINQSEILVIFGVRDARMARAYSEMWGYVHIPRQGVSTDVDGHPTGVSMQFDREPLASVDWLMSMPRDHQIIQVAGVPHPIYCEKVSYAEVKEWQRIAGENPREGGGKLKPKGWFPLFSIKKSFGRMKVERYRKRYWWYLQLAWWHVRRIIDPRRYLAYAALWFAAMAFAGNWILFEHYQVNSADDVVRTVSFEAQRALAWAERAVRTY